MALSNFLFPLETSLALPSRFPSPFSDAPHPLAYLASLDLQTRLIEATDHDHDFFAEGGGKMMGVLVVRDQQHRIAYLAAFSGMLGGCWQVPGFVPPVFDEESRKQIMAAGEAQLAAITAAIDALDNDAKRQALYLHLNELLQQRDRDIDALLSAHAARKAVRCQLRLSFVDKTSEWALSKLKQLSSDSQYDRKERRAHKQYWNERLSALDTQLDEFEQKLVRLKNERARLSRKFQKRLFSQYQLIDAKGYQQPLMGFFDGQLPSSGAGDCAGPKLLQYANSKDLAPLALAEFWWGAAPADGVRHHGHYYPACRGKCYPLLPFMLNGIDVAPMPEHYSNGIDSGLDFVYEDADIVVVNKPHGLLSVPGKTVKDSVLTRMQRLYPQASGPMMVHRLDMSTSGLLLVAKNKAAHKALQKQFINRSIEKRYVAILDTKGIELTEKSGVIELPLRVDLDDRPRQQVCYVHGKQATTRWQFIEADEGRTRVYFYPLTGRTHQLRIHAAHRDGMNAPIVGDELYGQRSDRLMLHAEYLCFIHPVLKQRIELSLPAPF